MVLYYEFGFCSRLIYLSLKGSKLHQLDADKTNSKLLKRK